MATQTQPNQSGTGSVAAGAADILHAFSHYDWMDVRLILRVVGEHTFRLNVMITPDSGVSKAVAKQVASSVVSVDGGTAGYVNAAELDIPVSGECQIEIWGVSGTVAYYFDKRFYYGNR